MTTLTDTVASKQKTQAIMQLLHRIKPTINEYPDDVLIMACASLIASILFRATEEDRRECLRELPDRIADLIKQMDLHHVGMV